MNRHILIIIGTAASLLGCQSTSQPAPSAMAATTFPSEISSSTKAPDVYFIGGAIDRGGVYNLAPGDRVTFLQAVVSAGGSHGKIELTADIVRHTGENPQFIRNISTKEILAGKRPDFILQPGDVISVRIDREPVADNSAWVLKCLEEINTIKVGATRADLLKLFEHCGGFSTREEGQYFYRQCRYFIVDVKFQAVENPDDKSTEHDSDRIIEISTPVLGLPPID